MPRLTALLIAFVLIFGGAVSALEFQSSKVPGRGNPTLCATDGDRIVINRADRTITTCNPDGSQSVNTLLNAGPAGRKAVELSDGSDLTVSPDASPAANILSRSLFESLRGSVFYVRPFITDLACAVDQTANINTALAAAPAGARMQFPPGCIATSGTIVNDGRHFDGAGRGATEWRYTPASGVALKMLGAGARTSNFLFTCSADRTTNTAIAIQMADGVQNPRGQMLDFVRARDCYDQVDVQSGEFWSITHFDLYRAKRYGLRIRNGTHPDSGDGSLVAGIIYTDTVAGGDAAVHIESGGGLKASALKILQFARGFEIAMVDDASTSDVFLDDSVSIEGQSETSVWLGRSPVAAVPASPGVLARAGNPKQNGSLINIKVNIQTAGAPVSVRIGEGVGNVTLAPILTSGTYGALIEGGYNIHVVEGTPFQNFLTAIAIKDPAKGVTFGRPKATNVTYVLTDERVADDTPLGLADVRMVALPQSSAYKNLYEIALPQYRGVRLTVQAEGILQNKGVVNTFMDVLASRADANVLTPATIASVQGGAFPLDIGFDVTTKPGFVRVGARPDPATGGGNFNGSVSIRVGGKAQSFSILP